MNKLPSKLNHMVGTKPAPREAVTPTKLAPREPSAAVGQKPLRKPERVSNREAAVMLGVEERTLADWRRRKVGPEYERLANGHVAYYRHQILDFKQRWEAAPEITGNQGNSKYIQLKKENEKLKKENEELKIYKKFYTQKPLDEYKKIIQENIELKNKLEIRDKLIFVFYEDDIKIKLRYKEELNSKFFDFYDFDLPSVEEMRRRLATCYSGMLVSKRGVLKPLGSQQPQEAIYHDVREYNIKKST